MDYYLIDTHAHFDLCINDAGYEASFLLDEMRRNKVSCAVQISTELGDFDWCESFASSHDNIFFTLGIHPGSSVDNDAIHALSKKTRDVIQSPNKKKLFGIGEIGLDYHWNTDNRAEQITFFEKQCAIAKENDLPVIIHSRDAFNDTFSILKNLSINRGILHCFSGDANEAKRFLDLGFYISFAGNLTYKKATAIQEAAAFVPDDRIFVETDCPYLSPQDVRGQKNHPAFVAYTYDYLTRLRQTDLPSLATRVADNFSTFIGD